MHSFTQYKHIELDNMGVPVISGTTMKVNELVLEHTAWELGPEELLRGHPQLTLAKIHSALAYYYDHKEAIDAENEGDFQWAEKLREAEGPSPVAAKLRQLGLLT